jgi:hypothetical protein
VGGRDAVIAAELKSTVLNQFSVDTTITGVVDILEHESATSHGN